jgi:hypothetical protein
LIINQHFYDYSNVWISLSAFAGAGLFVALLLFKETIPADNRVKWNWLKINPFACSTLTQYPYLTRLNLSLMLFLNSILVVTIIPGYVIALYSWKQDNYTYIQLAINGISAIGAGMFFYVGPRKGSRFALKLGFALALIGIACLVFSFYTSILVMISSVFIGLAYVALPAYFDELSKRVPKQEQGRVQSCKQKFNFI